MSIQTQIERLTGAKAALKTAIEQKGVAVPEGAPLEQYAPLVEQIVGSSPGVTYVRSVETIAEGTIAEGLPIYSFTDTGVSIPEILKQWKVFFVEIYTTEANNWNLHAEQNNNKPNIGLPAQKVCYAVRTFEQLEEGVNTVKVYGYYSTGAGQYYTKYSPDTGLSVQSNLSDNGFHNFEGTDHFYIRNYGAETTVAAQWRIVGIIKKEMKA